VDNSNAYMLLTTHFHETLRRIVIGVRYSMVRFICKDGESNLKVLNNVREIREGRLMSKTELARLAGMSAVTIDRIERGEACRMETMRKIILALGFALEEREKVFPD